MVSAMMSAAIKRQYSSVFRLRQCSPVFDEICGTAINFAFFCPGNTNQNCKEVSCISSMRN